MYSIVLMAAMTTGAEVPDLGGRRCHGCSGGCYGGCYGGWGCYGGGCSGGWGCYGGGCHGGRRNRCSGGWGCYGGGCYGGGCYGGGCYGSYFGGCYYGGYGGGGYGRGWASYSTYNPTGTYYAYDNGPVVYTAQASTNALDTARTATLVVSLPADATLTVDGTPTTLTSDRRVFTSPPLEPGQLYHYTLRAELTRDGQRLATTRSVTVQAGRQSSVTLDIPTETTSARR
jgi:uncharacterized protein (TIGR03000 family)